MSTVLTPPFAFKPIPLRMAEEKRWVNAMIVGYSGCGKTRLAETAPGPRLWLNCDPSGLHVIHWDDEANMAPPDPLTGRPITYFNFTDKTYWPKLLSVISAMERAGDQLSQVVGTVILDTATFAGKMFDTYLLSKEGVQKRTHDKKLSQADYGIHAVEVLDVLGRLCALPCHVVITAHVSDKTWTDESGETRLMELPNLGGRQAGGEAPGMLDLLGFMRLRPSPAGSNEPSIRLLQTELMDGRVAKVRARPDAPLPPVIEDPNLTAIFAQIIGTPKEASGNA